MSTKTPILLTGATGYIGGTVLHRLLSHQYASTFDITVLVRSEEKARVFQDKFGLKAAIGSIRDYAFVEKIAQDAHIVIQTADADDLEFINAINKGLKRRHIKTGEVPIFIHTSGTGVLLEDTKGNYVSETVYDDTDFEQVKSISPNAPHRKVDLALFEADKEGHVRTYIILPPTIYGISKTPFVDAGVQNPYSIQVPMTIKVAIARGRAGIVGKGLAVWNNAHIDDVAALYIVLYDAIVQKGPDNVGHGDHGYYFIENGEHSWVELTKEIGKSLADLKIIDNPEPTQFTDEELAKYFGSVQIGSWWGTSTRARAKLARALGWKPKYTKDDFLKSVKPEVEVIAKQQNLLK